MGTTELIDQVREHVYAHGLDATPERYAAELATWPGEPAGLWLRVSSGQQDEANQLPDLLRHCAASRYRPARFYIVHGRSASKGKHQRHLDRAVADMRHGDTKVLVIWHSDRLERRPPGRQIFDTLGEFTDAGGHVESTPEPWLGNLDFPGQVMTLIAGLNNADKSLHIKEQVKISQDRIRANGATIGGRLPWG